MGSNDMAVERSTHPRPTISTHVLDLDRGVPARGVRIGLAWRASDGEWRDLGEWTTDDDGRVRDLLDGLEVQEGAYELTCDFGDPESVPFFSRASVIFEVRDVSRSYHVPFLVSPFGISSYRGS